MNRRDLLVLIGAGAICRSAPLRADAAEAPWRIGYLDAGSEKSRRPLFDVFRRRLLELGYAEGRGVSYDSRYAEGKLEALPVLASALLALNPDALLVATTAANLAVKAATSTVPIVMIAGADPVALSLVQNLAHPGGNLTGVTNVATDLTGKRLELIKEIVPRATRIAVVVNPINANTAAEIAKAREAAQRLQVELDPILAIYDAPEIEAAFAAAVRGGAGAAIRMVDPLSLTLAKETAAWAADCRLPVIYPWRQNVEAGGLISYGTSLPAQYAQAAGLMDRILRGTKPADLPVEQPTKFELVVNLKAANALGIAIPANLLAGADEVIE